MTRRLRFIVTAIGLLTASIPATALARPVRPAPSDCENQAFLEKAKTDFQNVLDQRRRDPASVSDEQLREASSAYIWEAELCYQERYSIPAATGIKIDDGGLWMPGYSPISGKSGDEARPKHNLTGTKWGAGTSFLPCCDNQDASGPRVAGGNVTYSYMAAGISFAAETSPPPDTNTPISGLATFDPCFYTEIENAFAAWSAVSNITFTPVTDGGGPFNTGLTGNIRIGSHTFDGASGTLAHAFFPPPNGFGAAGDLHFDIAETWACSPTTTNGIDFGIVALHEIGHSIGLNHDTGGDTAVMDAFYNGALTFGPLADDIIGAGQIYGGSPIGKNFFFGKVGIGTDKPIDALHIAGNTNDTLILVNNTAPSVTTRLLLDMRNSGGAGFRFENTNPSRPSSWGVYLNNAVTPAFAISRLGTGMFEFVFEEDGDLIIQGNLTQLSDRSAKENLVPVDGLEILEKVRQLPILRWNYKRDSDKELHLGPTAQDFRALFQLGRDERHIAPSDTSGVALAAIQALHQLVQDQKKEIEKLQAQLEDVRKKLDQ